MTYSMTYSKLCKKRLKWFKFEFEEINLFKIWIFTLNLILMIWCDNKKYKLFWIACKHRLSTTQKKKCYKEISNATVMDLNPTRARNHLGLDFSNNYVCFLFKMMWLYSWKYVFRPFNARKEGVKVDVILPALLRCLHSKEREVRLCKII